jgi:molecular chaperone DnaK (HSP70)
MATKRVYGIDLGTTYSCIAYVDEHGRPVVAANSEGEQTTPSVVYFETPTNIVVGQAAKDVAAIEPRRVVSTVKRVMGNPEVQFEFHGQVYKPQDIASYILRKVVGDAEKVTGDKITDVVITVPAYFGINEKEATRQAGLLAGLNVLYVIPEPTAAAIAYGLDLGAEQTVLVYDLGGGTFDVTLIEVKKDAITVISTGGDHQLGGKNWDEAIVQLFAERFVQEHGGAPQELLEDLETYQELLTAAERCKVALSTRESVNQRVTFRGLDTRVKLTREEFEQITVALLQNTLSLTREMLDRAKEKGHARVDRMLLVGGSSYMPQVLRAVRESFPFEALQQDPNQIVAKGAASFGFKCEIERAIKVDLFGADGASSGVELSQADTASRQKAVANVARAYGLPAARVDELASKKVTNVTSKSFGIVVVREENGTIVERVNNLIVVDDEVPRRMSRQYGTFDDGQPGADLRVMESLERTSSEEVYSLDRCSSELGKAVLKFKRPLPKESPIEVIFNLTPDGLLELRGKDLTTGGEVDATFETKGLMTREELAASTSRNLAMKVS